eukprot:1544342-Rhodomonas_salina.1
MVRTRSMLPICSPQNAAQQFVKCVKCDAAMREMPTRSLWNAAPQCVNCPCAVHRMRLSNPRKAYVQNTEFGPANA